MTEPRLRIEVGAAINASFNSVIRAVTSTQKKAAEEVAREQKKAAKDAARAWSETEKWYKNALKERTTATKNALKERAAAEKAVAKEETAAAKKKADEMRRLEADVLRTAKRNAAEKMRLEKQAMAEIERDLRQHNRRREQEERRNQGGGGGGRGRSGFVSRYASTVAMRATSALMHAPMRIAGDLLRGAGADFDLSHLTSGAVERQKIAADISNAAWMPSGGGPRGSDQKVSAATIQSEATQTAIGTGNETKDILEGMSLFVTHTGDLQTIRDSMGEIGKIAKANGAKFKDMALAASEIANEMGDIPDKGKRIAEVMKALAGQGQMTAIELKDQAKYAAMIASQARFFKIDPLSAKTLEKAGVHDEVGQRIATVGALAQFARSKGGRVTAKMAMQSAMAFIEDTANPAQVKRWSKAGLNVYADAGHTQVRDPLQIILEAFRKGRGPGGVSLDTINNLFTNKRSRAVTKALAQEYNEAYEKAAHQGITQELERHRFASEQVTASFQNMLVVTQSNTQVDKAFGDAMQTADSKVKVFNAQLGKASEEILLKLIPAISGLLPLFTKFADLLTDKLGLKTQEQGKSNFATQVGAMNARSALRQATEGLRVYDENGKLLTPGRVKESDVQTAYTAKADLEKRIAETQANIRLHGQSGSGALGLNKKYGDMTDEELRAQENSILGGDQRATELLQERESLRQLKDSLEKLSTTIDKFEVQKQFGQIVTEPTPVKIVEDHTNVPGAVPHSSGRSDPDSLTSHE